MRRKIAYLLGIGLIVVVVVAFLYTPSNPRAIFERLVQKPIPESVRIIKQGSSLAMDSTFQVLHFEINPTDLQKLLSDQHFVTINEDEEFRRWDQSTKDYIRITKEQYFKLWEQRIKSSTKLDVSFSKDWQAYTLQETGGRKHIFSNSNASEAVFIAESH